MAKQSQPSECNRFSRLNRELEEENATLQAEYERLRSQQSPSMSLSLSLSPDEATPLPQGASVVSDVERDMLAEARLLRQHKTRLEARMKILEEHNRQLEAQLGRLRQLLDEVSSIPWPGFTESVNFSPFSFLYTYEFLYLNRTGLDGIFWWDDNKLLNWIAFAVLTATGSRRRVAGQDGDAADALGDGRPVGHRHARSLQRLRSRRRRPPRVPLGRHQRRRQPTRVAAAAAAPGRGQRTPPSLSGGQHPERR